MFIYCDVGVREDLARWVLDECLGLVSVNLHLKAFIHGVVEKGDHHNCNTHRGITMLSVPGKVLAHLLLMQSHSQLLKLQRSEQSGFMPNK